MTNILLAARIRMVAVCILLIALLLVIKVDAGSSPPSLTTTPNPTRHPTFQPAPNTNNSSTVSPTKSPTAIPTASPTAGQPIMEAIVKSTAQKVYLQMFPYLSLYINEYTALNHQKLAKPTPTPSTNPNNSNNTAEFPTVSPTVSPFPTVSPTKSTTKSPTIIPTAGQPIMEAIVKSTAQKVYLQMFPYLSLYINEYTALNHQKLAAPSANPPVSPTFVPTASSNNQPGGVPKSTPAPTFAPSISSKPTANPTPFPTLAPFVPKYSQEVSTSSTLKLQGIAMGQVTDSLKVLIRQGLADAMELSFYQINIAGVVDDSDVKPGGRRQLKIIQHLTSTYITFTIVISCQSSQLSAYLPVNSTDAIAIVSVLNTLFTKVTIQVNSAGSTTFLDSMKTIASQSHSHLLSVVTSISGVYITLVNQPSAAPTFRPTPTVSPTYAPTKGLDTNVLGVAIVCGIVIPIFALNLCCLYMYFFPNGLCFKEAKIHSDSEDSTKDYDNNKGNNKGKYDSMDNSVKQYYSPESP